ncbi:MAG: hypothetical protein DI537_58450 [Stutzerimonas stutzeri]|nr:MAG: hypothetical protein DI537_58450 [Stutzerimonas stutzeri]
MTAAPRKGRKVSFEAAATAPEADPWSQISTLRFMIDPPYGGELLVGFSLHFGLEGIDFRQVGLHVLQKTRGRSAKERGDKFQHGGTLDLKVVSAKAFGCKNSLFGQVFACLISNL